MGNALIDALWIYAIAIAVALAVAASIRGMTALLAAWTGRDAQQALRAGAAPISGVPAAHVAAIAAALQAALGPHRIVHIEAGRRGRDWGAEGRLQEHASHDPEHHSRR
jgi:hypothetical protein